MAGKKGKNEKPNNQRLTPTHPEIVRTSFFGETEKPINNEPDNKRKKTSAKPVSNGKNRQKKPAPPPVAHMEEERVKRRKPTKTTGFTEIVVLTISFLLFAVSIGGSMIKFITRDEIATMTVPYGNVDIPQIVQGVIIRNETVYNVSTSGAVTFNVSDKEKVRSGFSVCSVEEAGSTDYLVSQSEEISRKIIEMQTVRGDISAVSTEVNAINQQIKNEIDKNLLNLSSGSNTAVYVLKEKIQKNMETRNEKLLTENVGAVKNYVDEYRQYAGKIAESRTPVTIGAGGIVSYIVDGYEGFLNFENKSEISKEQTTMKVADEEFTVAKNVSPGEAVFKIIESNDWYIASYINNELIADWALGNSVKIYIERENEYIQHTFKIDGLNKFDKESYVLLKSDKQILDFLDMRTVSFKTFDSVYEGIKIPETAICEQSFLKIPIAYVFEKRENLAVNKLVGEKIEEVLITQKTLRGQDYDENFIYIMQDFDNIKRGDVIFLDSEDTTGYVISEIEMSQGVYRTNTGIATFISIATDGMVTGSKGYVILDSKANKNYNGLKIYDNIVTDVLNSRVKEGDIIN